MSSPWLCLPAWPCLGRRGRGRWPGYSASCCPEPTQYTLYSVQYIYADTVYRKVVLFHCSNICTLLTLETNYRVELIINWRTVQIQLHFNASTVWDYYYYLTPIQVGKSDLYAVCTSFIDIYVRYTHWLKYIQNQQNSSKNTWFLSMSAKLGWRSKVSFFTSSLT